MRQELHNIMGKTTGLDSNACLATATSTMFPKYTNLFVTNYCTFVLHLLHVSAETNSAIIRETSFLQTAATCNLSITGMEDDVGIPEFKMLHPSYDKAYAHAGVPIV
jgi:hypothetical protein